MCDHFSGRKFSSETCEGWKPGLRVGTCFCGKKFPPKLLNPLFVKVQYYSWQILLPIKIMNDMTRYNLKL